MRDKLYKAIDYLADDISRQQVWQRSGCAKFGLLLLMIGVVGSSIMSLLSGDIASLVIWILIGAGVLLFLLSKLLVRERRTLAVLLYVMGLSSAFVSALLVLFSFI